MAGYNFTTSGYIEVYFEGVLVSRHRLETEALESVTKHSMENNLAGTYMINRPSTKIVFTPSTTNEQHGIISANAFFNLDEWSSL